MGKHTPGSWKAEKVPLGWDIEVGDVWVAHIPDNSPDAEPDRKIAFANARLISSAPELLEALEKIAGGLNNVRANHRFSEARKLATAAIRKATEQDNE